MPAKSRPRTPSPQKSSRGRAAAPLVSAGEPCDSYREARPILRAVIQARVLPADAQRALVRFVTVMDDGCEVEEERPKAAPKKRSA